MAQFGFPHDHPSEECPECEGNAEQLGGTEGDAHGSRNYAQREKLP
jgi:hypothetical protein